MRPGGGGPCLGRYRRPFGIGRGLFPAPQDAEIDLLELGGRIHSELVGEQFSALVVRGDRLGLAPGGVERAHELGAGPFGQPRVAVGQRTAALRGQFLEGHHVDRLRRHGQAVPAGVRLDHVARPGLAQFGP